MRRRPDIQTAGIRPALRRAGIARPRHAPATALLAVLAVGLGALVTTGCGGVEGPRKPPGSALWSDTESLAALPPGTLERLREAGLRELFVPAGTLAWPGGVPQLEVTLGGALPRRAPVTLVVEGEPPPEAAGEEAGERLGAELARLRLAAEGRGLLAVGVHLDLAASTAETVDRLATAAAGAHPGVGEGIFLSARLDPELLAEPAAEALAGAVDFLVCPLYGQPPEEREQAARWRLAEIAQRVARLEELGRDYLVGVVILGAAYRTGPDGARIDATTEADLTRLVRDPALDRTAERLLEGWDRRVLTFEVRRPTRAAGWELDRGETVRAVQVQGRDLVELRRRLGELDPAHYLGELYYRAPGPEERLALPLPNLADALLGVPPSADLEVELRDARTVAGGLTFRVALVNAGEGATDVAFYATNYVEMRLPGGTFAEVSAGDFRRYAMMVDGREATDMRAFRNADTVRLYATLVEGGEEVVSGPIVVRAPSAPSIEVDGEFALPGGSIHKLPVQRWP